MVRGASSTYISINYDYDMCRLCDCHLFSKHVVVSTNIWEKKKKTIDIFVGAVRLQQTQRFNYIDQNRWGVDVFG